MPPQNILRQSLVKRYKSFLSANVARCYYVRCLKPNGSLQPLQVCDASSTGCNPRWKVVVTARVGPKISQRRGWGCDLARGLAQGSGLGLQLRVAAPWLGSRLGLAHVLFRLAWAWLAVCLAGLAWLTFGLAGARLGWHGLASLAWLGSWLAWLAWLRLTWLAWLGLYWLALPRLAWLGWLG